MLHRNILVNNKTKPEDFWIKVKDSMKTKPDVNLVPVYFAADVEVDYSTGVSSIYNRITATVWNMDDLRNKKKILEFPQ